MQEIKTIKDVEYVIRRAVWADRRKPKDGPRYPQCPLGRMIKTDDTEMSLDDRVDYESPNLPSDEDFEDCMIVKNKWLSFIPYYQKAIVWKRCGGMGWKRLADEYSKDKRTIQRYFNCAIRDILSNVR